ncbi:MAG: diguanylate cyclase [Gammaproteobacteria bacterium]|nr:diguanylate cyclase [Gammaproteobacteria bacterium]
MRSSESNLFEKRRSITDADRRQLTAILTLGWAALTCILFSLIIVMDYRRFESDFYEISLHIKDQLDARIAKNEAVLEGFASFLAGMETYDEEPIYQYAKRITQRFPHVFMLEVATKVAAADVEDLVNRQRELGYPDFQIKSFDYRGSRSWRELPEADFYYPLTFIYPLLEASRPVLGLDLGSHENLSLPLQRALTNGTYQTSLPFRLVEGYDAYVMFMPVQRSPNEDGLDDSAFDRNQPFRIVLIVLLQEQLIEDIVQILPGSMGLLIYHSDKGPDDPIGWLFNKTVSDYAGLPGLVKQYRLEPEREGFMLRLERYFGMDSISVDVLAYAALAAVSFFFFIRFFILRRYQREIHRSKREARLELLASYDPLTKLPNRNLFQDWLEEYVKSTGKEVSFTAVLMDLEDLKLVNERHGHTAGDHILEKVAERIQQTLRADDLVARIGGDEFVALLTHVTNDEQVSEIVAKLNRSIQQPIRFNEASIAVKVNIGVAFYPEGTSDPNQLIQLADKVMYQEKRTRERRKRII